LLHREFSVRRVVVFGSLAHRAWFTDRSDIDLAAWGIPVERYYRAVATVTGPSPLFKVDLVDPATCRPSVRQAIETEGIEL
jgi:Nucleotidyltransferase domain.